MAAIEYNDSMYMKSNYRRKKRLIRVGTGLCVALMLITQEAPLSFALASEAASAAQDVKADADKAPAEEMPSEGGKVEPEKETEGGGAQEADGGEEEKPAKQKGKTRYTTRDIKLFKKRSSGSGAVKTIPKGTKLRVTSIKSGWGAASYDGASGFVRTKYLSGKAPSDSGGADEPAKEEQIDISSIEEIDESGKIKPSDDEGDDSDVPGIDDSGMKKLDKSKKKARNWGTLVVLGEGGMPVPILYQTDYRQTVCVYNGVARSVSTSGCGPTSLSMVIAYLTGDTEQSPYTLFREACQSSMYRGNGVSRRNLEKLASRHGVKGIWKDLDAEQLVATLKGGTPVIANMGPGYFTERGHYIVLRGVNEDGLILVNDPASADRSSRAYPAKVFIEQSRSGAAFMLVSRADGARASKEKDAAKKDAWHVPTRSGYRLTM